MVRMAKKVMAILLVASIAAGCGTDTQGSGKKADTQANTHTDGETADDAKAGGENTVDDAGEERTEVRREKYDDCDGSGHGYVEIYYSDGSMETEEY